MVTSLYLFEEHCHSAHVTLILMDWVSRVWFPWQPVTVCAIAHVTCPLLLVEWKHVWTTLTSRS